METDWDLVDAALHNPSVQRQPVAPPSSASSRPTANTSRRRSVPYTTSSPRPRAPPQTASSPATSRSPQQSNDDRNMQLALHHARLIQQRKEIEASILQSTIVLIDYPLSTPLQPASPTTPRRSSRAIPPLTSTTQQSSNAETSDPASNPSSSDAASVKQHLRHFQPADYDALIRERNIEHRCGYVLCPRSVAESGRHTGKFALLTGSSSGGGGSTGGRGDLRVVETSKLMRWCENADECARRAMYLRVQLDETPAWERHQGTSLKLYDEDRAQRGEGKEGREGVCNGEGEGEGDGPGGVDPDGRSEEERGQAVARMTADLKKLALERGSPGVDKLMSEFQSMSIPHR